VTASVRFRVLAVHCRHCKAPIEIEIDESMSPDAQLAECERQAEAKHLCPKLDPWAEPEEPLVP
jgi:hypothetical protein